MIRTLFEKNKPVNFVVLIFITTFFIIGYQIGVVGLSQWNNSLILSIIILFATIFMTDWIDKRHHLTANNSYSIFFFATTFSFFPYWVNNLSLMIANLLVAIALFRLLGVTSKIGTQRKFLDASLLIIIASFFYNWTLLFLLMVWVAIIFYTPKKPENSLIPLVAIVIVCLFAYVYFLFSKNLEFLHSWLDFRTSLNIYKYQNLYFLIPTIVVSLFSIISSLAYLYNQKQRVGKNKVPELLISSFVISLVVALLSDAEGYAENIFFLLPFSIILTLMVERIGRVKIKNTILWFFAILPFVLLLLHFIPKG